nr:helix-turn-helix domain-containing protein [uncultured Desulfovibrio sp.]
MGQKHLTQTHGEIMERLPGEKSLRSIADLLGYSPAAISREVRRNANKNGRYAAQAAQRRADWRASKDKNAGKRTAFLAALQLSNARAVFSWRRTARIAQAPLSRQGSNSFFHEFSPGFSKVLPMTRAGNFSITSGQTTILVRQALSATPDAPENGGSMSRQTACSGNFSPARETSGALGSTGQRGRWPS